MNRLWLMICLLITLGTAGQSVAAEATAPVYLNGERSEIRALTVEGVSYLPLRELAEILAVDIDWNQGEKRVDYGIGNRRYSVWVERGVKASMEIDEAGELSWSDEWESEYAPLVRDGKVWLALREFEHLTEADICWDEEKRAVDISGIPVWRDGRWKVWEGKTQGIVWDGIWPEDGVGWVCLRVGEPIMGHDWLWRLDPDGGRQRVASDWNITALQVWDGRCYWLSAYMGFAGGYDIWATDGVETVRYGREDMIYNNSLVANGPLYVTGGREQAPEEWRVDERGVWAVGFARAALSDEVVTDEELARQTYGLYRLWPGGQEMVKKYELPRKPTVEERFEQGDLVWVPLEAEGGEESGEGGYWSKRFGPEPFLAVRKICELLGCELIWRQETDQLEIVAEGERWIIDCDLKQAEKVYTEGYEVRAVRIRTGADGKESREEHKAVLSEYGAMRTLPWDFYQGLNGAKLEWDREGNVIRITK